MFLFDLGRKHNHLPIGCFRFLMSQRYWVRPQRQNWQSVQGYTGVDLANVTVRQWPVLGLWLEGPQLGTGTRRLDRDKKCFANFLFTVIIFKNSYNVSQIIAKFWNKGFSFITFVSPDL